MKPIQSRLAQHPKVIIIVGAATLLCVALLAFRVSPVMTDTQPTATSTTTNLDLMQTKQVNKMSVMLAVTPGKINVADTITVKITDTHTGQFVTNARITISVNMDQMDMGTSRATMTGGTPVYSATFAQYTTFSMTGTWDITLAIQLPQQAQNTILFQVWVSG